MHVMKEAKVGFPSTAQTQWIFRIFLPRILVSNSSTQVVNFRYMCKYFVI